MMNKRVLRKFAIPSNSPNPKNGIFCADQVKYSAMRPAYTESHLS